MRTVAMKACGADLEWNVRRRHRGRSRYRREYHVEELLCYGSRVNGKHRAAHTRRSSRASPVVAVLITDPDGLERVPAFWFVGVMADNNHQRES